MKVRSLARTELFLEVDVMGHSTLSSRLQMSANAAAAIRGQRKRRQNQRACGSKAIQVSHQSHVIFHLTVAFDIDFGTVTILWSQPVASLQILSPDGKWRYIKHIDNALVRVV